MKITRRKLRQIIQETLATVMEGEMPTDPAGYDAWFKKNYIDWLAGKLEANGMESSQAQAASKMTWQEYHGHEKENLERVKSKMASIGQIQWGMYAQMKPSVVRDKIHGKVPYDSAQGTKPRP
tara:strand:+ start:169 stop:537 length:369 start_codon:yes stop_codon:yes gene_type:complete